MYVENTTRTSQHGERKAKPAVLYALHSTLSVRPRGGIISPWFLTGELAVALLVAYNASWGMVGWYRKNCPATVRHGKGEGRLHIIAALWPSCALTGGIP